jgi:hypothetical protein
MIHPMTFTTWRFFLVAIAGWMKKQQQDLRAYYLVRGEPTDSTRLPENMPPRPPKPYSDPPIEDEPLRAENHCEDSVLTGHPFS